MSAPLYTTIATSFGDGLLDVTLAVPTSMGGPGGATNPEQLFAAGWSSCFHSALKMAATRRKVTLVDSTVAAEISMTRTEADDLALNASLRVHIGGGIDQETAERLTAAAHDVCPYSATTRGNVPTTLTTTVA
jgi:Ohr subfamily peroxiredoxin